MIKEAIILAGGFGTRLQKVVKDVPKPMALINQKPFLNYLLKWLSFYGVSKVIFAVGYKYEIIKDFYGDDYNGVELSYSIENEPLGTGGAIRNALKNLEGDLFLVLNGDSFFDINLYDFSDFIIEKSANIGLALKQVEDVARYGSVNVDKDQRIIGFSEKSLTSGEGYMNAGIYIMKREFLLGLDMKHSFSIEKDVFEKMLTEIEIFGFNDDGYFIDIGVPEDYYKAQNEFKEFKY